jgi:protein TonB
MKGRLRALLIAVGCMILATPGTFALIIAMNKLTTALEEEDGPGVVSFDITPVKKKKKKKVEKREIKVSRRPTASRRVHSIAPLPSLGGGGLAGVEINMPEYEATELGVMSDSMLGEMENMTMTEDAVDTPPVPKIQIPPKYPPEAKAKNIESRLLLRILIGSDGFVKKIKFIESDYPEIFNEYAFKAVSSWVFEPATYKSRNVEMWATLPIEFKLN